MKRACSLLFVFSLLLSGQGSDSGDPQPEKDRYRGPMESAFIGLKAMTYEEIEPFVRPMLSPDGRLGYFKARHVLVVHDIQEVLDEVRAFVEAGDANPVNIRIEVEFLSNWLHTSRGIETRYDGKRQPKIVIEDGKIRGPARIEVELFDQTQGGSGTNSMTVLTTSGSPASIWVGETIAQPAWLNEYNLLPLAYIRGRPGNLQITIERPELVWRDVGNALYVLPTYQEGTGLVHIELFPVVSFLDRDGKSHKYRVEKVSTTIVARPGQRVLLGGGGRGMDDYLRRLPGFEHTDEVKNRTVSMYVTPHVKMMDTPPKHLNVVPEIQIGQ
mgnify:CR=1 FL=1